VSRVRTRALRHAAAGALCAGGVAGALVAAGSVGASRATADPATWEPWHLSSASQFRLPAPPAAKSATTKRELRQLLGFQRKRTTAMRQAVKKWTGQSTILPWTDMLLQAFQSYRPRPPAAAYDLALFYTGVEDAMIAAYDSRDAFAVKSRPAPSKLDKRLKPLAKVGAGSTYASPEAAIAGAAQVLIPYLFPDAPASVYVQAANESVKARQWAGLNYRSDVERARALGEKVAQLVIAQAKSDGRATNTAPPTPNPGGEDHWTPTPPGFEPPFGVPAGTWRPWLMTSNTQFLYAIPGPSTYGSPAYIAQLLQTLSIVNNLTQEQRNIAFYWDDGPGTLTPPGHWISIAETQIKKYRPTNEQAVRELALQSAAEADAGVEAWNIKYTWWSVRPITGIWRLGADNTLHTEAQCTADPSLCPWRGKWYSPITTPAFPSYPSAHATFSGAASTIIGYFFPGAAAQATAMAEEAAQSRVYGGIHYPEDSTDGLALGRMIGNLAIARAKADGGP
jgi:membrane-associated phospholipid phosphatase